MPWLARAEWCGQNLTCSFARGLALRHLPAPPAPRSAYLRLCLPVEVEAGRVDAVALAARVRAVVEEVPEVGVAGGAADLGADHAVLAVLDLLDLAAVDGRPEAGPPGAGVELGVRLEQRRAAHDALVHPDALVVPVLAGEGPLGGAALRDLVLHRREALLQLGVARLLLPVHGEGKAAAGCILFPRFVPEATRKGLSRSGLMGSCRR